MVRQAKILLGNIAQAVPEDIPPSEELIAPRTGIRRPEDAPSSEGVATPRSFVPVPSKTAAIIDLIDIRLHSRSSLRCQTISRFKQCNDPYSNTDLYRR